MALISIKRHRITWSYGRAGVAGSAAGELSNPDDAYLLTRNRMMVADIRNCRVLIVDRAHRILHSYGSPARCYHHPPDSFSSPNGATPLSDGGVLITEIGGWIDRLDRNGNLVYTVRTPTSYPSDAQLLPDGDLLVAGFNTPGRVDILSRTGNIKWTYGPRSGPGSLDRPSLAVRWPNGMIAVTDDWHHRIVVINPKTQRIVWQYGHFGIASSAAGYLSKPDGLDLLPAIAERVSEGHRVRRSAARRPSPRPKRPPHRAGRGSPSDRCRPRLGGRAAKRRNRRARRSHRHRLIRPSSRRETISAAPHRHPAVATHDAAAATLGHGPPLRRRTNNLIRRHRPPRPGDRHRQARGHNRRAALRPRRRHHRPHRLPRRRIHRNHMGDRDPALRPRPHTYRRRPTARWAPLHGRRLTRRPHLHRWRNHHRRNQLGDPLIRHIPRHPAADRHAPSSPLPRHPRRTRPIALPDRRHRRRRQPGQDSDPHRPGHRTNSHRRRAASPARRRRSSNHEWNDHRHRRKIHQPNRDVLEIRPT